MGDPNPNSDISVGTVLDGRYELTGEIARGGFGMVYVGRQLNMDRAVAVKTIPPEFMNLPDVVERFKREAKLASRLSHPNTVTVHDYGQHGDTLFLVMELLEGEDLADILAREESLEVSRITRIARQVLKSLTEAHDYNIVHRDLKPENIFLSEIGAETDFVKVVDFGIAKLAASEGEQEERRTTARRLTVEGNTVGTPTYMSPEQAAGGQVDARTDLYALGVIMYEMACGHPPFENDDPAALMRQHIFEEPPHFDVEKLRGGWLEAVVMRALAKDKADRFDDAPDFLEAIDQAERWQGQTAEHSGVEISPVPSLEEDSGSMLGDQRSRGGDKDTPESTARHTPSQRETVQEESLSSTDSASKPSTTSSIITVLEPSKKEEIILLDRPKDRPAQDRDAEAASTEARQRPKADSADQVRTPTPTPEPDQRPDSGRHHDTRRARNGSDGSHSADQPAQQAHGSSQTRSSESSPQGEWSWGEASNDRTRMQAYDDPMAGDDSGSGLLIAILLLLAAGVAAAVYFLGLL